MQEHYEIEQGQKYQCQDAESQVESVCLFLQKGGNNIYKKAEILSEFIK